MEETIREMILNAEKNRNVEMAEYTHRLMEELAITFNCPSNWRCIGENMAAEFQGHDWVTENCKLYDF